MKVAALGYEKWIFTSLSLLLKCKIILEWNMAENATREHLKLKLLNWTNLNSKKLIFAYNAAKHIKNK